MKYMGSKSRVAKYIVPVLQSAIDGLDSNTKVYVEPFVGGANIIDKISADVKLGFDNNPYLIALFHSVQNGTKLPDAVSREDYNAARDAYRSNDTSMPDGYIGAVGFLASYNGRFFDGGYAAPGWENGKYRDYYQEAKRNLEKQIPYIRDCDFMVSDYKTISPHNAVIYCDPPYANTKQYATHFDTDEFWAVAEKWSEDNTVFVSELAAPEGWVDVLHMDSYRSIKPDGKFSVTEKLFTRKK